MQQAFLIGFLFVGALVLAGGGIYTALAVRKWMRTDDSPTEPFTLHDLRELHARGELTEAEFQALRAEMIGAARGRAERAGGE